MNDHREGDDDLSGRRRDRDEADEPEPSVRALLVSLHAKVDALSGLPQTVQDLGTEVVRLRSVVERLEPRSEELTGDLHAVERTLKKLSPQLDRFQVIADYTMPEFIERLEKLTAEHVSMKTEIKRVERESLRAAAGGEDA